MRTTEDRSWAEGLNEETFFIEYQQKYPKADSFPTREMFLAETVKKSEYISRFELETMEEEVVDMDIDKPKAEKTKDRTAAVCVCGKTYDHPNFKFAHLGRHQLKCKTFLNSR